MVRLPDGERKEGDLHGDRRHLVKVYGTYSLPWNASAGFYGIYQSGTTGGRAGAEFVDTREFFQNKLRPALDDSTWDTNWRELGNMTYDAHQAIPLFLLPAQAVVDPTVVADYQFSGTLTGTYTNVEYIKPAG